MTNENSSLVIGTRNPGKVREIETILGDISMRILSLAEFENVDVAPEDEDTYAANAIAKARYYARATGTLTLADDSGLEVSALGGAPGVHSARYAGEHASDNDRRIMLLQEMAKASGESREARFVCTVAIASADESLLLVAEGMCEGAIWYEPRGTGGFGYDPLFIPKGYDQTFAELSDSIKNTISHRARALLQARAFLLGRSAGV